MTDISVTYATVNTGGMLEFIYGDDYYNADSRAINYTITGFPSISGGTVSIVVSVGGAIVVPGTVVDATHCRFEFTSAILTTIGVGYFEYNLQVVLANTHTITLLRSGTIHISPDVR